MEWASEDNSAEWTADIAAAALFAAAVAFAVGAVGLNAGLAIAAAAGAALLVYGVLRNVSAGERSYSLPAFELAPLELINESGDELLLDDELPVVEPGARVIRLFDPRRMPASADPSNGVHPDASQALTEALAELRRSLR